MRERTGPGEAGKEPADELLTAQPATLPNLPLARVALQVLFNLSNTAPAAVRATVLSSISGSSHVQARGSVLQGLCKSRIGDSLSDWSVTIDRCAGVLRACGAVPPTLTATGRAPDLRVDSLSMCALVDACARVAGAQRLAAGAEPGTGKQKAAAGSTTSGEPAAGGAPVASPTPPFEFEWLPLLVQDMCLGAQGGVAPGAGLEPLVWALAPDVCDSGRSSDGAEASSGAGSGLGGASAPLSEDDWLRLGIQLQRVSIVLRALLPALEERDLRAADGDGDGDGPLWMATMHSGMLRVAHFVMQLWTRVVRQARPEDPLIPPPSVSEDMAVGFLGDCVECALDALSEIRVRRHEASGSGSRGEDTAKEPAPGADGTLTVAAPTHLSDMLMPEAAQMLMALAPAPAADAAPSPTDTAPSPTAATGGGGASATTAASPGVEGLLRPGGVPDVSGTLRVSLCRWLSNACFEDAATAKAALAAGALHAATHHRALDPRAPVLRDWAQLVIRNACTSAPEAREAMAKLVIADQAKGGAGTAFRDGKAVAVPHQATAID